MHVLTSRALGTTYTISEQLKLLQSASERGGNTLKCFKDVYLNAKAATVLYVPYYVCPKPETLTTGVPRP